MKYEVVQQGKQWVIRRIKDKVIIDKWDKESLARKRLELLVAMGWNMV